MLPKSEAKLQDAEANESKQVVMKCKINCTPRPTIQWFKNGPGPDITGPAQLGDTLPHARHQRPAGVPA